MSKSKNLESLEATTLLEEALENQPRLRFVTTSANFTPQSADVYEYPSGASETVPSMAPDLKLMLQRSAQGQIIPIMAGGYSEENYPDFFKMDEFELSEYRLDLAERMKGMQDELHAATKRLEQQHEEARKNAVTNQQQNPPKTEEKPNSENLNP